MSPLLEKLRAIVTENRSQGISDIVTINALKEYLQHAVLDFVYNSTKYSHLVMYGGTLLRICYDLPRMSEDLDFQTSQPLNYAEFEEDIVNHFRRTYNLEIAVSSNTERATGTDMLALKFDILRDLGFSGWSVLKLRFDVNVFENISAYRTEVIPKTKDTFSYVIRTYPLTTLMASKVGAVFNRVTRNIGGQMADCKPRDVYDLMWYMEKKIIPDMAYLKEKGLVFKHELELFKKIAERVSNLKDIAFEADLGKFFYTPDAYNDWFRNWRQRFTMLYDSYEIFEVTTLAWMRFAFDVSTDNHYFHFLFEAKDGKAVKFTFILTEEWYRYAKTPSIERGYDLESYIPEDIKKTMSALDFLYARVFYEKIMSFLKRHHNIVLQSAIRSKVILFASGKLNTKTQVLLDEYLLLTIRLEDLL